jgi:transposase
MTGFELSDSDWERVAHLFVGGTTGRGRPRSDSRAILWVKRTGEKWHRLPDTYPPQQTCYGKYLLWRRTGLLQRVEALLEVDGHHYL